MTYSICIATYKRPELLRKLLESLFTQNVPGEVFVEIIVVDNDAKETAKNICSEFKNTQKFKLYYLIQPEKNISLTRNKAVHKAIGEYIFFIDDDEIANPNWMNSLIDALIKYNADGVFGKVISYYEEGVSDWIKKSHFFKVPVEKTGEPSKFTRTGNCVIKTNLLKSLNGPFDPEFGLTGGEDGILFGKLSASGAKFIFSAEAFVYDFVPKDKANLNYLTKRTFRIGITYTRRIILSSKFKLATRVYLFIKGVLYTLISILLFFLCSPVKLWRSHWYLKIISNVGHIGAIFNIRYEIYKK